MHASALHICLLQVTILRLPYYFYFSKPKGLVAVTECCHFCLPDWLGWQRGRWNRTGMWQLWYQHVNQTEKKNKESILIFLSSAFIDTAFAKSKWDLLWRALKVCLNFSLLNRGFMLDLILKLVGAKIICQQLYDQTE